jgi:hypothetical protein
MGQAVTRERLKTHSEVTQLSLTSTIMGDFLDRLSGPQDSGLLTVCALTVSSVANQLPAAVSYVVVLLAQNILNV